jgi:hypothetical protein
MLRAFSERICGVASRASRDCSSKFFSPGAPKLKIQCSLGFRWVGGSDDGGLKRQDGWRGLATAQAQQLILDRREATKWASDSPARRRAEIVDDGDAEPELSEAHHELPAIGFDGRRPCLAGRGPGLTYGRETGPRSLLPQATGEARTLRCDWRHAFRRRSSRCTRASHRAGPAIVVASAVLNHPIRGAPSDESPSLDGFLIGKWNRPGDRGGVSRQRQGGPTHQRVNCDCLCSGGLFQLFRIAVAAASPPPGGAQEISRN